MTSITQKVSSYALGVSEQPDELKVPGQVVTLKNGVPDIVSGCVKRPGSNLVAAISPSTASNTKWFSIYREDTEQYIGQVDNVGAVKVFRCSDGASIPVDYSGVTGTDKIDYLNNSSVTGATSADIQPLTINETTFICNRQKTVAMKTGSADLEPPSINEAYIALDTISYAKQYALDIYDPSDNTTYSYPRATAIVVDDACTFGGATSGSGQPGDGSCHGMGRETVTSASTNTGTAIWSTSPPNASAGGKTNLRYEMDTRCTPQPKTDQDDIHANNYYDAYAPFCKLQFGGEGWTTNDTHAYTSQKGVGTTITVKNHVTVTSRANIAMIRPEATSSDAQEHVSAAGILGEIKAAIDAISGHGITATIVGNGIHLYRASSFGVSTTEKTLMNIITSEANDITDLPKTCRHNYRVRIVNSGADQDDYYLKFKVNDIADNISQSGTYARSGTTVTITAANHGLANGDTIIADFTSGAASDGFYTVANSATNTFTVTDSASGTISAGETVRFEPTRFGEGVWEECAAPGSQITFDDDTMPVKLVRELPSETYANGRFLAQYPDWASRDAGDDVTNPLPSFVGYKINKMLFFRNRIALLSAENVILSRTNDFYNFWAKTALTISNDDPIDLQSSSTFPTALYDAVEANTGLVIFSASQQFLLNSGAEALLTPETAKISYLASYAFNEKTRPFSLGTTIGFLNSTAKNARFYEMANIQSQTEPDVLEQSKVVSKLFPENSTLAAESTENDMILFAVDSTLHTATSEVWGYRFFNQGQKRIQSAWFKWTMPNNVVYHSIMDDVYYAVLNTGSTYTLEKFDLKIATDTTLVGDSPDSNRIHLDTKKIVTSANLTYNTGADTTTFTLGAGYYSTNQLEAYTHSSGDKEGRSANVSSVSGTAPNETVTLAGNWKYYEFSVASGSVNTTAETMTITSHTLSTGDAVTYQEGSSGVGGLTDNTVYYVIKVDANTIKLATNSSNATAGTAINLTSQGGGTHKLQVLTDLIVGYEYEFELELPKIYIQKQEGERIKSDTRGSLVIHRLNFFFGDVGVIDVTLKRKGKSDYTKTYESTEWDSVTANTSGNVDGYIHTIPVYERNTNLNVHLKSNHPSPASLHSMNWEGDYSPKYYRRV